MATHAHTPYCSNPTCPCLLRSALRPPSADTLSRLAAFLENFMLEPTQFLLLVAAVFLHAFSLPGTTVYFYPRMCTRTYGLMNVLVPLTSDCSSRGVEPQETTSNCVIERLTLTCIQQRVAFRSQHWGEPLRFLTHGNGAGVWLPKCVATVSLSNFKSPLCLRCWAASLWCHCQKQQVAAILRTFTLTGSRRTAMPTALLPLFRVFAHVACSSPNMA